MSELLAALLLGAAFGATAQRTHFCTMGAIADVVLFGSLRRVRTWLLATAVALAGTQLLVAAGWIALDASLYRAPPLAWLGLLLGGTAFGFGMVLAGGCVSRNLVRLGGGSLKALVVLLVTAATAAAMLGGWLAPARAALGGLGAVAPAASGLDGAAGLALGLAPPWPGLLLGGLLAAGLAAFCLLDPHFRQSRPDLLTGLALGLLPPLYWLLATPPEASGAAGLTFLAPLAESLAGLVAGPSAIAGPALGLTLGTVAGAALMAGARGQLRLEIFAGRHDMLRNLAGGVLMGAGGGLAGGCTIGHGITGIAALGYAPLLALAGMVAGAVWALRWLETGRLLPQRLGRRGAGGLDEKCARGSIGSG
jgi:uncharacterized membrane protein YedE/YeeE